MTVRKDIIHFLKFRCKNMLTAYVKAVHYISKFILKIPKIHIIFKPYIILGCHSSSIIMDLLLKKS